MKAHVLALSLSLGSVAGLAAAPSGSTPGVGGGPGLAVYHWWTSSSELAAVDALAALFRKQHPDVSLSTKEARAHGGGGRMFAVVSAAADAGRAPGAFQVHAGAPLRPYFDAGLLSPIDEVWQASGLDKAVPPIIKDMSVIDGRYYSLPVNVHRNNLVWYNKALLDAHRIDPATLTSWDALFAAGDRLRAAGVRTPFQMGESWTASVAFESILAGMGMAGYEDWVNGRITAPEDPRLLEAFEVLRRYLSYANSDHARTPWDVAIRRVLSGEAAFCVMGDWAHAEFRLAGKEYGKDYGAIPAPGTRGLYGVSVDSFAEPRGAQDPGRANRFLTFAGSRAAQDAFNTAKGSIPARLDAEAGRYDRYQRAALADFKTARVIYPNLASAAHDAFKTNLDQVMVRFGRDLDVRQAAAAVAGAAAESRSRFTRAWSLR